MTRTNTHTRTLTGTLTHTVTNTRTSTNFCVCNSARKKELSNFGATTPSKPQVNRRMSERVSASLRACSENSGKNAR
jgi:hypothetical protein